MQPEQIYYSFCSLVTDPAQYRAMVQSFVAAGFEAGLCEYLQADNSAGGSADGYTGLNKLITKAKGRYVVLLHQDVIAFDSKDHLDQILANLTQADPNWAVAGNAGCDATGALHIRITDRHGFDARLREPAQQVMSLDENFIILRKDSAVRFSDDLSGFHLYGTDIVFQAHLQGRSAYVVDFHLEHLGKGEIDQSFVTCMQAFQRKYSRLGQGLQIKTPSTRVSLGPRSYGTWLWQRKLARRVARGTAAAWSHRLKWLTGHAADLWYRQILGRGYVLDGIRLELPDAAPLGLRKLLRQGRYLQGEAAMIAKHLRDDLPVVLHGPQLSLLTPHVRRAIGLGQDIVTVESLGTDLPDRPWALVTAEADRLFDLLQHQPTALANCQMIVLSLRPVVLHDSGRTVSGLMSTLGQAGFQQIEAQKAALVLRRAA